MHPRGGQADYARGERGGRGNRGRGGGGREWGPAPQRGERGRRGGGGGRGYVERDRRGEGESSGSQQYFQGRGQCRGSFGGRRGGRGPPSRDTKQVESYDASESSSSTSQGNWGAAVPLLSELLPGLENLSLEGRPPAIEVPDEVLKGECLKESRALLVPPNRPKLGTLGIASKVRANHFVVKFNPGLCIYHYDVEIEPKVNSKAVARKLQQELCGREADFRGKCPVYDGSKSMYTAVELPFDKRDFSVIFSNESREKTYKITIKLVATLNLSSLSEYLLGRKIAVPQDQLQALDVALRQSLVWKYTPVGRSFFTRSLGSVTLDGGLTAWNGFFQSLRPTSQGLVLNVDLVTTAFYEPIEVVDFLGKKIRSFDPRYKLTDAQRNMVKKALSRLKVEVTHRPTPRKYRIYGLSPVPAKDLRFSMDREGGMEIGIIEYFKNTYNYSIKYPELPCLQVQATRVSYLPMEVCKICEGQKYVGKLSEEQTTGLRNLACVKPFQREEKVKGIMGGSEAPGRGEFVTTFGLSVSSQMTTISARILQPPKLRYGMQGQKRELVPRFGSWNMNESCLVEGGTVDYWAFISFDRSVSRLADDIIAALSGRCQELGINMASTTIVPPYLGRREELEGPQLERCLTTVCTRASKEISARGSSGTLQILVCILGEKTPAYGELKRICETKLGVVTQCCLSKNIKKFNSQYLANVALKINAKVGGRNNNLALELPQLCGIFKRPTIIFGADVTHPNPGDDSSPSIAAVVANVDWPSAVKYVATVRAQAHREEMIAQLKDMVQELWSKFCDKVNVRPERIIMFRDGVSEGQFDAVLQCEVHALKEAMLELGGSCYTPQITWVVIQKRHHTRLFPADNNKDKSGNVSPGTVVDTTITHPREFDFYLCSHAGIQGTSKPTHYHVLWDENGFTSDEMQTLINNMCYTYARCTRSISVVPPAHYAHLAAYRARLYIDSQGGSDVASQSSGRTSSVATGGRTTRAAVPAVRVLPRIANNVQDVMYFC